MVISISSFIKIADLLEKFCAARYDAPTAKKMLPLWQAALPFIEARHWNGPAIRVNELNFMWLFSEFCFNAPQSLQRSSTEADRRRAEHYRDRLESCTAAAPELLRDFAALRLDRAHEFVRRDELRSFRKR